MAGVRFLQLVAVSQALAPVLCLRVAAALAPGRLAMRRLRRVRFLPYQGLAVFRLIGSSLPPLLRMCFRVCLQLTPAAC